MTAHLRVLGHMFRIAYRADRRVVIFVLILAAVNSVAVAATGASLRWLVDSARIGQSMAILLAAVAGAFAYALIATVQRVQHNLQVDLTERVDLVISQEVFSSVASVPTVEHLERSDYLDRLSQLEKNTEALAGVCWTALGTFSAMVSLGLSVFLLFEVHPALVLLAVLAAPPLIFSRRATRFISRAKDLTATDVRREKHLHDLCTTAGPAKELKISGAAQVLSEEAAANWDAATEELVKARTKAAMSHMLGWAFFAAGHVGALGLVVYLISRGNGTVGALVLVASLASYLRVQLTATVTGVGQLAEANHAVGIYRWLKDYADKARSQAGSAIPAQRLDTGIQLRGVSFQYPGTTTDVLKDVDLDVKAGSVVALVGINGAGKTTLVKLLSGMYQPSAGQILLDGKPLQDFDAAAWSSRITGAFQDFAKLQTLVRETVGVGDLPRIDDTPAVQKAVDDANATSTVGVLPSGLETQLGAIFDGTQLSHGQWQKLALARGLMRQSPVLSVLDEPTAALDPQAENDLYERFVGTAAKSIKENGGIILLVSHRFSTVSMADHIIVLSGGKVVEQGSHQQLMSSGGEYAELYEAHARGYA